MLDCAILGDSIAVGISYRRPDCVVYGQGGWNSWQVRRLNWDQAKVTIIALGSNDHPGVNTKAELGKIRDRVTSPAVFWIMPTAAPATSIKMVQDTIREIAGKHGDAIVEVKSVSPDGIHPSQDGYRQIIQDIRQ